MKTEKQMAAAAAEFAERWKDRGYERGESQPFWIDLLANVFGIEMPTNGFIRFEEHHKVDESNYVDGRILSTRVLIEQKSKEKDLRAPIRQSDGALLNPFQQARRYVVGLPVSEHPRWIVTCNFQEFLVYDMEQPNGEPEQILLANLDKEYYRLQFLVDAKNEHLSKEMEVSMQAGEIVGKIYDALLTQYDDNSPEALRWLNILCVRIVFCLYAEDAGVFSHDQFHDYLVRYEADDLRNALIRLFEVLNTPPDKRSKYLKDDLKAFPYTNGGLFEEEIEIPQFTEELKQTLLQNASLDFDWSEISPTIFGAVFESTLNPETRRSGGMHYTSIENIHKVIDPLFLNDLRRELDEILEEKVDKQRKRRLSEYQMKLASLTFLDPACGSGNFLTETYLSLRRLENEAIREMYHGQTFLGFEEVNPIKLSIQQFYGIEINDFAVAVATTALWISEAQMLAETEKIIRRDIDFLPLKSYHNIREGNALRMDWDVIEVPSSVPTIYAKNVHLIVEPEALKASEPVYDELNIVTNRFDGNVKPDVQRYRVRYNYIIGNPPFVGLSLRTESQQDDMANVFKGNERAGRLDYVAAWYKKAADLIKRTNAEAAFVSTNSIVQGEQVPILWEELFRQNVVINFAHRTFVWSSEASQKAHVHCVIIGFSNHSRDKKYIFENGKTRTVNNINGYLVDADNVFIQLRGQANPNVPKLVQGNKPWDGGNLILSTEERNELIAKYPQAESFIHKFIGSFEFINRRERYCLWLKEVSPNEYRSIPEVMERLARCAEVRRNTKTVAVQAQADTPMLFSQIRQPESDYILVPETSSSSRRYIPMGFMSKDVIASNSTLVATNATLYLFGIMTSNVHMAWMRTVCGRLKSDYRYSPSVYNNFPWPNPTEEQKAKIEQTAQAILDARALYPDSSLADLYDELTMPVELRRAHQDNDRAVMQAYGFPVKTMTESQCVAELFKMYQELTK